MFFQVLRCDDWGRQPRLLQRLVRRGPVGWNLSTAARSNAANVRQEPLQRSSSSKCSLQETLKCLKETITI